jgi:hypothetical protein
MGSFNPQTFRSLGGTISEKLADCFSSIGVTANGVAATGELGKLMGSGSMAATRTNTATTSDVPLQVSQTFTLMGADNTGGAGYFKTFTGAAIGGQLATLMVRTTLGHNLFDAYGLQSHVLISGAVATTDANAHITAISGKLTLTSNITKGWSNAGLFIVEGAGTATAGASNMCHGVSIVCEAGVADSIQSLLHLYSDSAIDAAIKTSGSANMTYLVKIDGATGAAVVAAGKPAGHDAAGYISIYVGASAYALPFWAVGDMANS